MTADEHRELDMQVAETVFGWKRGRSYANGNGEWEFPAGTKPNFRNDWDGTPHYSTDIAAAWMVVEHLRGLGMSPGVFFRSTRWYAWTNTFSYMDDEDVAEGGTAAEAICRHALKAVST